MHYYSPNVSWLLSISCILLLIMVAVVLFLIVRSGADMKQVFTLKESSVVCFLQAMLALLLLASALLLNSKHSKYHWNKLIMLLPIHNLNFWVCIRLIFSSNAQIGKDGKVKTHIHLLIYPSIVWCDLKLYFQMSLKAFEGTNVLFDSIKNENDQHYWKKKRKEQNTFTQRLGERNHFSTFRWWAYAFLSAIMKPVTE